MKEWIYWVWVFCLIVAEEVVLVTSEDFPDYLVPTRAKW